MASPASPEASEIRRRGRQRLIGAIAIAVLLVVFVPMILDSEPRSSRTAPAIEIPSKDNAPALPPPAPAKAPSAPAKAAPAPPPAVPSATPPAPRQAPAVPSAAPTAPASQATPPLEGFAVQVGAFKDEDKLKQARDKIAAAGIKHYIERLDTQSGGLTRLRAGPFPNREAADKALAVLRGASLDGQVIPLP